MRKIHTQTKSDSLKDHIGGEDIHEDIQDVFEHSENPDNINEMFSVSQEIKRSALSKCFF
jgi:hypothetical protein